LQSEGCGVKPADSEAVRIARELGMVKPAPAIDWKRVAKVYEALHHPAQPSGPRSRQRPLPVAASRDPCPRCGIPGLKGCAHQAPCDHVPVVPTFDPEDGRRGMKYRIYRE
jgi:hypothetical protein